MSDIPSYVLDPIRIRATLATNTRSGKALVEIRCAVLVQKGPCGRPLGGAWRSSIGVVVVVNRLRQVDSVRYYQRLASRPDERTRKWKDEGAFPEEPVLIEVEGRWERVPGSNALPTVRCLGHRHGDQEWTLDIDAVIQKVHLARITGSAQTMGSIPQG